VSPGWLRWAWENASPSLRTVAQVMQDQDAADALVYKAFMTSGRRALIGSKAVLEWARVLLER
jgi:hypothetical protein